VVRPQGTHSQCGMRTSGTTESLLQCVYGREYEAAYLIVATEPIGGGEHLASGVARAAATNIEVP